jgi:hypothetical protein
MTLKIVKNSKTISREYSQSQKIIKTQVSTELNLQNLFKKFKYHPTITLKL